MRDEPIAHFLGAVAVRGQVRVQEANQLLVRPSEEANGLVVELLVDRAHRLLADRM